MAAYIPVEVEFTSWAFTNKSGTYVMRQPYACM